MVTYKFIKQNDIQRRHKFYKHLSLWDWQGSGVSARNKFRCLMAPSSP